MTPNYQLAIFLLSVSLITVTPGCLSPESPDFYTVRYLGDGIQEPAVELEDNEVKSQVPALGEALEEARGKGINASVTLSSDEVDEVDEIKSFLMEEREEDPCECGHTGRYNWTGSTFLIDLNWA